MNIILYIRFINFAPERFPVSDRLYILMPAEADKEPVM